MKVQSFAKNEVGNDYVVGDIHGCFRLLQTALHAIGFNPNKDRLFSVGDLIDRGPDNAEVLDWLEKPWFHAIKGNHEQMIIDTADYPVDEALHIINGAGWWYLISDAQKAKIVAAFKELPEAIEVETERGLVGIVHAEVPMHDWSMLRVLSTKDARVMHSALWGREKWKAKDTRRVAGVKRVYVGHTPVRSPTFLGNVHYIDTGACFGRALTLLNMNTGEDHRAEKVG